jgi:predicted secreted acid phosphatase
VVKPGNDETPFIFSRAVQFQQLAAEYQALARTIFKTARDRVDQIAKDREPGSKPWVVSVDADETVLDNSPFQKDGEEQVLGFTDERWDIWVQKKKAAPVPGALGFISHVLSLGGKVAIVSNRLCNEADATRENLQQLGFPANPENVCIMVRPAKDKDQAEEFKCDLKAEAGEKPANDKDARWLAVEKGTAEECWSGKSASVHASWSQPHDIVLYVGDNVQDFPGITQGGANEAPELVTDRLGSEWFLIPNPAYGSWDETRPKRKFGE